MMLGINKKILRLKIFCWLSISCQNQQNFKITMKMIPLQGAWLPTWRYIVFINWGTIFILVSSISYLSIVKKAKWFFDGKNLIFQNSKVENFKNLEILQIKRDLFNFLQAITFDTFKLANWNFLHMFYTGNTTTEQ